MRAFLFDFWGTLATGPPTLREDALRRALAAAGVDRPFADAKAAWDGAKADEPDDGRDPDLEERFRRTLRALGLRPRFVNQGAKAARRRFVDECANAARLAPGAVEALRALPPEARVAVVSNFPDAAALRRALDRMGLSGRLDAVVCSGEVGRRKPDPAPYRLALERLGARPEEAVVIGDGEDDVQGALAVGARAVLLRPDGGEAPAGAVVARDLGEAVALATKA